MSTFVIQPHTKESVVAIKAVKESLESRKYNHYVKPIGKIDSKGICTLSYIDITTDYNKAIEYGFVSPSDWLEEQKQFATNKFKQNKEKICS